MTDEPTITVTLAFPQSIAERLAVLDDDPAGEHHDLAERVTAVMDVLADHAQTGVRRGGAWERSWLVQAFGLMWLASLESDPDNPGINWWRPRRGETRG